MKTERNCIVDDFMHKISVILKAVIVVVLYRMCFWMCCFNRKRDVLKIKNFSCSAGKPANEKKHEN